MVSLRYKDRIDVSTDLIVGSDSLVEAASLPEKSREDETTDDLEIAFQLPRKLRLSKPFGGRNDRHTSLLIFLEIACKVVCSFPWLRLSLLTRVAGSFVL